MLSSLDVLNSLNYEPLALIGVGPRSLSWSLVVQHIRIGYETISLDAFDLDAKDSRGDHHPYFGILPNWELSILGDFLADEIIVSLDVFYLLFNLVQEGTPFQILLLFISEEYWEVRVVLWKDIDVRFPNGIRLSSLLHNIGTKERMLG